MRKIVILLLSFTIISMAVKPAMAEISSNYPVGEHKSYYPGINPITEMVIDDDTGLEVNVLPSTTYRGSFGFNTDDIVTGSEIQGAVLEVKAKRKYGTGVDVGGKFYLMYDDLNISATATASSSVTDLTITGTSYSTFTFYLSNGEADTFVSDYFYLHGYDPDKLSVVFELYGGSGTLSSIIDIDYMTLQLYFDEGQSYTRVTNNVASPSAQLNYLDLVGDTGTKSAEMKCQVDLFSICSGNSVAGFRSESPVATIRLDPAYTENYTYKIAPGEFMGHGFSETSSAWAAEKVEVPYEYGYTCTYDTHTLCTTDIYTCNEWGCYLTGTTINMDDYDQGDQEVINDQSLEEPEPTNPLQWLLFQIKKLAIQLLSPNIPGTIATWDRVLAVMKTKIPFYFFWILLEFDFSPENEASTLEVNFPSSDFQGNRFEYKVNMPEAVNDIVEFLKPIMSTYFWFMFMIYLIKLPKRFLPGGSD